jgi:hypothetical protein
LQAAAQKQLRLRVTAAFQVKLLLLCPRHNSKDDLSFMQVYQKGAKRDN